LSSRIELEYEVLGSGRDLLLIGGLGAQLISWDDGFCEQLAAHGYRVIRYDNRDAGLSTGFESSGVPDLLRLLLGGGVAAYTLDDMTADAVGLLDQLEVTRADVIGLSLGGMVGQLLALGHPERVRSLVAALCGPAGRPSELPAPEVVEALLQPPGDGFEGRVRAAVALRRALAGGAESFDSVEADRRARLQVARAYRPDGTMRQAAAVLATPSHLAELDRITAPALVVHGEIDPLVPFVSAREAAARIPGAALLALHGVGHDLPSAVAEDLITQIVAFQEPITDRA
jgi:pimeloyl-ACP methyl ester carboxylesterase